VCARTSTRLARRLLVSQGAGSNDTFSAIEPADHALGRSRGGLTTKIHALSDQWCSPVLVLLSPGQAGDNPMLAPLIETYRSQDGHRFRLLADKAYSHPSTRVRLRGLRIPHTIPERSDQIAHRKAKGSHGGRPPAFDPDTYAHRNTVERSFNRLKHWRGIATRYDKYAITFLGGVTLASLITHYRVRLPDTT
jgi:putative transposase